MQFYNLAFVFLFFVLIMSIQCRKCNSALQKDKARDRHNTQSIVRKLPARNFVDLVASYHERVYGDHNPLKNSVVAPLGYINCLAVLSPFATGRSKKDLNNIGLSTMDGRGFVEMQSYIKSLGVNSVNFFYHGTPKVESEQEIGRILSDYNVTRTETPEELQGMVKEFTNGKMTLTLSPNERNGATILNLMSFNYSWLEPFEYHAFENIFIGETRNYSNYFLKAYTHYYSVTDSYTALKFHFKGMNVTHEELENMTDEEKLDSRLKELAAYFIMFDENDKKPMLNHTILKTIFKDLKIAKRYPQISLIPPFQLIGNSTLPKENFQNIFASPNVEFPLIANEVEVSVKQRAYFCVDEFGTAGGAASQSIVIHIAEAIGSFFDHPFYYLIMDEKNGKPIFYAYVNEVAEEEIKCT